MNKIKLAIIGVAAFLATVISRADEMPTFPTNAPAELGATADIGNLLKDIGLSSNPTNYFAAPFIGHSLTGNKLSAGLVIGENINNNVGVVGGIDHLWFGGKTGSANMVSGGISLKAPFYPIRAAFGFLKIDLATNSWSYNFRAIPYVLTMVATPLNGTSNDGGLAAINRTGANFDIYNLKGFEIGAGIDYGNRIGAGAYSGNWIDAVFTIRKGF